MPIPKFCSIVLNNKSSLPQKYAAFNLPFPCPGMSTYVSRASDVSLISLWFESIVKIIIASDLYASSFSRPSVPSNNMFVIPSTF